MKRFGILTSGGDCQGLNAAIRGVAKALYEEFDEEVEIYGIQDGYRGLIEGIYCKMKPNDFSGILTKGGTILGSSRTPYKLIREPGADGVDKVAAMKQTYYKLQLDCLVILGGNGTHKTANLLRQEGLNIVTLPKTIDNDLWGTDMTFGFQSAVNIATDALDCIHTTAASHGRVFIVEVMGHKVGWLTLNAGIAGGADIILVPEIPYDIDKIVEKINSGWEYDGPAYVKGEDPIRPYFTPRDRYGNAIDIRKVKPKTGDACCGCGICAEVCPMGSIDKVDFSCTGICIKCCACIKKCPSGAKYFDDPGYIYHKEELEEL